MITAIPHILFSLGLTFIIIAPNNIIITATSVNGNIHLKLPSMPSQPILPLPLPIIIFPIIPPIELKFVFAKNNQGIRLLTKIIISDAKDRDTAVLEVFFVILFAEPLKFDVT